MKFLLLAQDNSASTNNIIGAFEQLGHEVDVVLYHEGGQQRCHIIEKDDQKLLSYQGREIDPKDYDGAKLRSWGTAALGAELLEVCEEAGIPVLNETSRTTIMNSKIVSARLFAAIEGISFPKTVTFRNSSNDAKKTLAQATEKLGQGIYVFKADYGTRGSGIHFVETPNDLAQAISTLPTDNPGFLLQQFIGSMNEPISHYRVLVSKTQGVTKEAIKFTAQRPLYPSNGSTGSAAVFIPLSDGFKHAAEIAAKHSGLTFCGVDMMEDENGHPVILEVNDGPATNRFDDQGHEASLSSVKDLVEKCEL